MLIIEGTDLVGKSHLVKRLVNGLRLRGHNYASCHLGRLAPGDRFDEYLELLRPRQVWDRLHVSELAYRAHDDVEPCITSQNYRSLDLKLMTKYRAMIVILTAPESIIRERHAQRGDDVYDLERILAVNRTFLEIAKTGRVIVRGETYKPMFHSHVRCSDKFPDDMCVEALLNTYLENL